MYLKIKENNQKPSKQIDIGKWPIKELKRDSFGNDISIVQC